MSSIYSVIFWIFLSVRNCRPQCATETLDDKKFAIIASEHIQAESIDCIKIKYNMTFPQDEVTVPFKKKLFEGDPSNIVSTKIVKEVNSDTNDSFILNEHRRGEFEFGFILEWGCNQTYVFPKKVHISVTAPSKPYIYVRSLVEGQVGRLHCLAPSSCSRRVRIHLLTMNGRKSIQYNHYRGRWLDGEEEFSFYPTAEHHNTNITCLAQYKHDAVERTVPLTVKFSPKILNDSHCLVKGEQLVCVCISWGNPLPPVIWPLKPLTDFSISSSSNNHKVSSTITLSSAEHHNSTMKCISTNELGQTETEILIKNSTEETARTSNFDEKKWFQTALPGIAAVCFSLNLVFITVLIICIYQISKKKQKKPCEENNTYASLRKAEVEDEYSIIPS